MGDFTGFMPEETGAEQIRVESFFKPNLQLLDRVLGTRQQMYNTNLDTMAKAKAKVEEVNSLEGFDRNEWMNMQENYDKDIQGIMSLYEGDLSKANGELSGFTSKVGKDFGIHGKATAINERALGYMMNKKEMDKRLAERKITPGQYFKLSDELEKTAEIGIGTDAKAYKGWRKINPIDAIDFDAFAKDFLTTKNADYEEDGWKKSYDASGFFKWEKIGHESITYDSVMKELGDAYRNKAETTGQLVDDFDYHLHKNKIKITGAEYITKYTNEASSKRSIIKQLEVVPKTNEERVSQQVLINKLQGREVKNPNGILSYDDVIAKRILIENLGKAANQFEQEASRIETLNDDGLRQYYYGDYVNSEIRRLADPYAGAKSYDKISSDVKFMQDPWLDLEIHKRKAQFDKEFNRVEAIVNTSEAKSAFSGKDNKDITKVIGGLREQKRELESKLNDLLKAGVNDPQTANEVAKLKREHGQITASLSSFSDAQFKADEGMKKLGMNSNTGIINDHVYSFVNNLNNPNLDENKSFNSNHYALIVAMTPDERKKSFGTDDIEKIKDKNIQEVNIALNSQYGYNLDITDPFKITQRAEKLGKVTEWVSDNLYDDAFDIGYTSFLGAGMGSAIATTKPFEKLRTQVTTNSNNYVKRSNQDIYSQQTEFYHTDPTKGGNLPINFMTANYANALGTNPQGFRGQDNKEATILLKDRKFTSKDATTGKKTTEVKADLSKVKPEDIATPQRPLDGIFWMQVRLRDQAGNPLFEANGDAATEWVVPENQVEWESQIKRGAIDNLNGLLGNIKSGLSEYDKTRLNNISGQDRNDYLNTQNQSYLNYIGTVASTNFLADWQRVNKVDQLKPGQTTFVATGDVNNPYYAISRSKNGQYGIHGYGKATTDDGKTPLKEAGKIYTNEAGELELVPGNPNQLLIPNVRGEFGADTGNSFYFNSPYELARALQFTQSIKSR
jgi:hypothetical protein